MDKIEFIACWLYFDAKPDSEPPFKASMGIKSTGNTENYAGNIFLFRCQHIPDAIERFKKVINSLNIKIDNSFTLVYPIYAVSDELESTMHSIAWIVKENADKNNWKFEREIPELTFN